MVKIILLQITRWLYGAYSLKYYKLFISLYSKDLAIREPYLPATDDGYIPHIWVTMHPTYNHHILLDGKLDLMTKIRIGSKFKELLATYGPPDYFSAFIHRDLPVTIAAYKGKSGKVKYKKLFFYVSETLVLNKIKMNSGSESDQAALVQKILELKNLNIILPETGNTLISDNLKTNLLLLHLAFGISVYNWNSEQPELLSLIQNIITNTRVPDNDSTDNVQYVL
jgi:hypothetical protein